MTKETVLAILTAHEDFVSGEQISRQIGVSRMAVSTAVKSLRSEGYDITSVTRRGYRLNRSAGSDRLKAGELMAYLPEERMKNVVCLDTVDSTNNYMKKLVLSGAGSGTVVLAEEQTGGKGKSHGTFRSPRGKGIYLSMLFLPADMHSEDLPLFFSHCAEAVCRAVETTCGILPEVKGINDICIHGKKICGILTEVSMEAETGLAEYLIAGIGIRVRQTEEDFAEDPCGGSLLTCTGKIFGRAPIAAALIRELDRIPDYYSEETEQKDSHQNRTDLL